jgi:hypothetical protein
MTPKEKAEQLVDKFKDIKDAYYIDEQAKKRALIAVDEIIRVLQDEQDWYWPEVKEEIEKL